MKKLLLSASLIALSGSVLAQVQAPSYSSIWTFGDSLSDTGRTYYSSDKAFSAHPVGPNYYAGRFSNGPVWVENLHTLNPQRLNYVQSHNLAYGGAVLGDLYALKLRPFVNNLQEQVSFFNTILQRQEICDGWALSCNAETDWLEILRHPLRYSRAKASSPDASLTSAAMITRSDVGLKPLVTFVIGGNNFRQELEDSGASRPDPSIAQRDLLAKVPVELRRLNDSLAGRSDIAQNGVTYYVATVPNIAQTPKLAAFTPSIRDSFGTTITQTNRQLKQIYYDAGREFAAKNPNTRVVVVDFDALLAEAINAPGAFGFTESRLNCVNSTSGDYVNGCSSSNANQYLFWDEFHPTAAGHEMISRYARNTDLLELGATATFIEPYVANIELEPRTFAGSIDGIGSLIKQGEQTLTLAGNNTYQGGTRIDHGTLRINADANLGDRAGRLTLQGGILQTAQTTTIQRDITVDASQSGSKLGGSAFGGTFQVDADTVLTLADNTLSGKGDILKTGLGGLDIRSTVSDARKLTQVDQGMLSINSRNPYQSDKIVVEQGAFLNGSGTLIGETIIRGQARPGNSIGVLNVIGDLTLADGSAYEFEAATHNADFLHVTGNVVMDGDIVVSIDTHEKVSDQRYPLLGYTGTITGLDYDTLQVSPFLSAALIEGHQQVDIAFSRDFSLPAQTEDQRAFAAHLSAAFSKQDQGDLNLVFDALDSVPTNAEASRALDVLSGRSLGNALTAAALQQGQFTRLLEDHVAARRQGREVAAQPAAANAVRADGSGLSTALGSVASSVPQGQGPSDVASGPAVWARVIGGPARVRGASALRMNSTGVLVGIDQVYGQSLVGASLGYGHFSADGSLDDHTRADLYQLSLYGSVHQDRFFVDGTVGYGYADYRTRRALAFGEMSRTASGKPHGGNLSLSLKSGLRVDTAGLSIEPSLGFDWYRLNRSAFTETGAGSAGLHVESSTLNLVLPSVGVRVSAEREASGMRFSPELSARYYYNAGDRAAKTQASLIGVPAGTPGFTVTATEPGRSMGVLAAGLSVQRNERLTFFARYELTLQNQANANAFSAGLQYRW